MLPKNQQKVTNIRVVGNGTTMIQSFPIKSFMNLGEHLLYQTFLSCIYRTPKKASA